MQPNDRDVGECCGASADHAYASPHNSYNRNSRSRRWKCAAREALPPIAPQFMPFSLSIKRLSGHHRAGSLCELATRCLPIISLIATA